MESLGECDICGDNFTSVVRSKIECPACNGVACKNCIKNYLLNAESPQCMFPECAKKNNYWSRMFYATILPITFIKGALADHQKNAQFQEELGHSPYTLVYIERDNKIRGLRRRIVELNAELDTTQKTLRQTMNRTEPTAADSDSDDEKVEDFGSEQRPRKREVKTRYACPAKFDGENCRGYIHGRCICAVCNNVTCVRCYCVIGELGDSHKREEETKLREAHTCKPEDVASMDMIKKETVTCPTCSQGIYKISGCNQVSCSSCATVFDMKTKRIVRDSKYWHAPGAQANIMKIRGSAGLNADNDGVECQDRMPVDIYVGGIRFTNTLKPLLIAEKAGYRTKSESNKPELPEKVLENIVRMYTHIVDVEMVRLDRKMQTGPEFNLQNRAKYLRGETTEKAFKTTTHRVYNQRDMNRDKYTLMHTMITTMRDMVWSVYDRSNRQTPTLWVGAYSSSTHGTKIKADDDFFIAMENLRIYFNEQSLQISVCYALTKYTRITTNWDNTTEGETKVATKVITPRSDDDGTPKKKMTSRVKGKANKNEDDEDEDFVDNISMTDYDEDEPNIEQSPALSSESEEEVKIPAVTRTKRTTKTERAIKLMMKPRSSTSFSSSSPVTATVSNPRVQPARTSKVPVKYTDEELVDELDDLALGDDGNESDDL